MQLVAPSFEDVPARHGAHAAAPPLAKLPAAHGDLVLVPSHEKPAGQGSQLARPPVGWTVPLAHGDGSALPGEQAWPRGHSEH